MTFIDTHAHIYLDKFSEDRDEMLQRAFDAGVTRIVMPAIDLKSIEDAITLTEKHDGLFVMAALHPSETKDATDSDFESVSAFCDHPKVVAVGESGLDYYWDRSFDDTQQYFFRKHIRLAIEKDLPLILHIRESWEDVVRILHDEKGRAGNSERLRGIFHCFSGPKDLADAAVELGFHLGVGGTLTFKKSTVAADLSGFPLSRIVLETDAPFLAPQAFRGKRNEPAYLVHVGRKLAEINGLELDEIARRTTQNAERLFGLRSAD